MTVDERIDNLFEGVGTGTDDWYDIHTLGDEPDIECIHLTPKAKKAIKQLITEARIEEMEEYRRHVGQPKKDHPIHGDERYTPTLVYIKNRIATLKETK